MKNGWWIIFTLYSGTCKHRSTVAQKLKHQARRLFFFFDSCGHTQRMQRIKTWEKTEGSRIFVPAKRWKPTWNQQCRSTRSNNGDLLIFLGRHVIITTSNLVNIWPNYRELDCAPIGVKFCVENRTTHTVQYVRCQQEILKNFLKYIFYNSVNISQRI
jgi:hypothetical protein